MLRGLLQSFFEQEVMKNWGYEHFYSCLKSLKFVGGGGLDISTMAYFLQSVS